MRRGFFHRLGIAAKYLFTNRYEGATYSPDRSILPGLTSHSVRLDVSASTRTQLLMRARWWERNSSLIQKQADIYETYSVGSGILYSPASSDEDWNARAAEWYEQWVPFADLSSRQSFLQLQQIAARAGLIDGELFFVLTHGASGFPRIQAFESHQVETPPSQKDNPNVVDGVRIDERGRPIGYFFVVEENRTNRGLEKKYREVDAENVVHVYEPSRVGQLRGFTQFHSALNDCHDLEDLMMSELRAARDASQISNVYETGEGAGSSIADAIASGGDLLVTESGGSRTRYEDGLPGKNLILNPGDKVSQFAVNRPSENILNLFTTLEHRIASSVGIPLQMIRPGSIQGTVERAILCQTADWFKIRAAAYAECFARIYRFVLRAGIRTPRGKSPPPLADPPHDWYRYSWRPPKAVDVDPGRSGSAQINALAAGTTTFESIYASLGLDWKAQLRQRAREAQYIRFLANEYKVTREEIVSSALPPPSVQDQESAQEDAEDEMPIQDR